MVHNSPSYLLWSLKDFVKTEFGNDVYAKREELLDKEEGLLQATGRPSKRIRISLLSHCIHYTLSMYPSVHNQLIRTLFEAHIVVTFVSTMQK